MASNKTFFIADIQEQEIKVFLQNNPSQFLGFDELSNFFFPTTRKDLVKSTSRFECLIHNKPLKSDSYPKIKIDNTKTFEVHPYQDFVHISKAIPGWLCVKVTPLTIVEPRPLSDDSYRRVCKVESTELFIPNEVIDRERGINQSKIPLDFPGLKNWKVKILDLTNLDITNTAFSTPPEIHENLRISDIPPTADINHIAIKIPAPTSKKYIMCLFANQDEFVTWFVYPGSTGDLNEVSILSKNNDLFIVLSLSYINRMFLSCYPTAIHSKKIIPPNIDASQVDSRVILIEAVKRGIKYDVPDAIKEKYQKKYKKPLHTDDSENTKINIEISALKQPNEFRKYMHRMDAIFNGIDIRTVDPVAMMNSKDPTLTQSRNSDLILFLYIYNCCHPRYMEDIWYCPAPSEMINLRTFGPAKTFNFNDTVYSSFGYDIQTGRTYITNFKQGIIHLLEGNLVMPPYSVEIERSKDILMNADPRETIESLKPYLATSLRFTASFTDGTGRSAHALSMLVAPRESDPLRMAISNSSVEESMPLVGDLASK